MQHTNLKNGMEARQTRLTFYPVLQSGQAAEGVRPTSPFYPLFVYLGTLVYKGSGVHRSLIGK